MIPKGPFRLDKKKLLKTSKNAFLRFSEEKFENVQTLLQNVIQI